MRIQSTKRWLAVALSLGVGGARGDGQDEPAVTFNDTDFQQFGNRDPAVPLFVFGELPFGQQLFKTFNWKNQPNLQIEQINLWAQKDGKPMQVVKGLVPKPDAKNGNGSGAKNSMGGKLPEPEPTTPGALPSANLGMTHQETIFEPQSTPTREPRIDDQDIDSGLRLNVSSYEGGGSVTINNVRLLQPYALLPLYLGAVWSGDGYEGETYSRVFGVVDDQIGYNGAAFRFSNVSAVESPVNKTASTTFGQGPGNTSPATMAPIPSAQGQATPNEGLATGAIIGIAVACGVFGLLLIGAGIWFLIRRRNRQAGNNHVGSPGRPYGVDRSRTEDLIAEKEASAGGADPSPHSPYSDDGVVLVPTGTGSGPYHHEGSPIVPMGVGGAVAAPGASQHHQHPARSYTPYSDHGSLGGGVVAGGSPSTHAASIVHSTHEDTSRAGMGSPTAGRATPHSSLSPRYAHLVEEGMTEDEIRRLEDEERQLDAAIEQARGAR